MRADAVDLEINGTRIRVVCDDRSSLGFLRSALAAHLSDQPAPAGFMVKAPTTPGGLHVLLDRSGFVLARTRTARELLSVLGSHLAALLPPPGHTIRLGMKAVLRGRTSAVLLGFPIFSSSPAVERQLERRAFHLVDRLVADVRSDCAVSATPTPWPEFAELPVPTGHAAPVDEPIGVDAVIVPTARHSNPTMAQSVSYLANLASSGNTRERVQISERLTSKGVLGVPASDTSAVYAALGG